MSVTHIPFLEGEKKLDWPGLIQALSDGHKLPKAKIQDTFIYRGGDTLLSRSAWIDSLGLAVKSATVFPDNTYKNIPIVNGAVSLFSDKDGILEASIDFQLVTKWKTAGDSLLAASRLVRKNSRRILIVGAGTVGRSLREAYAVLFPAASFMVWNRSYRKAVLLADDYPDTEIAEDLRMAVENSDIVATATMAREPLIKGEWLRPGQHIDLIGAFRPDMREVDDNALLRARLFVDSCDTTIGHIGEIKIPMENGVISRHDLIADYYDFGKFIRESDEEITIFKNGGGAHLDLMTSKFILDRWNLSA